MATVEILSGTLKFYLPEFTTFFFFSIQEAFIEHLLYALHFLEQTGDGSMSGLLQVLLRKLQRLNMPVWFLPSGFIYSNIEMLNLGSIDILDQLIFCYERLCCAVWGA